MSKTKKHRVRKLTNSMPPPPAQSSRFRSRGFLAIISLLLIAATLIVFWPVKDFPFIDLDDDMYVTWNPLVQGGVTLKGMGRALATMQASNWHPLAWLSHMVDYELCGLNPGRHHFTNLVFHLVNTLLLFWVLHRMTGGLWRSGFVALLFALHPLHVESVAWVSERKDVLSTFFWMLTMAAYALYVKRPSLGRYGLVLFIFSLGLLSKPMLVTLPFVLLLLDYWPLGRLQLPIPKTHSSMNSAVFSLIVEKVPFFLLVICSCVLTLIAQQAAITSLRAMPLGIRISNALITYVRYLAKMIWPSGLAIQYPYPNRFALWQVVGAALLLIGISVWAIRQGRKSPYLVVGWLWYVGTLLPVIGLVQVGSQAMADRYTYMPLVGVFIMMVYGISEYSTRFHLKKILLPISAILLLITLSILTRNQLRFWKDSTTLFKHSLDVTVDNDLSHNSYGVALAAQGRNDEAISHYQAALQLSPHFADADSNLGNALVRKGEYNLAIDYFRAALRINPLFVKAYNGLGLALMRQGKHKEAIDSYLEAIRLDKDYAAAHSNLGAALDREGKTEEAIKEYQKALQLKPAYLDAHYNLANLLARQKRYEESRLHFLEILRNKPDDAEVCYLLGVLLSEQGKHKEAIDYFAQALQIRPDYTEARFAVAVAHMSVGDRDSALRERKLLERSHPEFAARLLDLGVK